MERTAAFFRLVRYFPDHMAPADPESGLSLVCKPFQAIDPLLGNVSVCDLIADAGLDKLKKLGHDNLLAAGVVDMVRNGVKNFNKIYDAIQFTESSLQYVGKFIKLLQSDKAKALIKQDAGAKK